MYQANILSYLDNPYYAGRIKNENRRSGLLRWERIRC